MIALTLATIFSLGLDSGSDRTAWHFDNPSSWDTAFNVPHFFEQTYRSTRPMLTFGARGPHGEFEAAASASSNARGTDFDTFFQPSGDVVVHGTATDVAMRSWRAAGYLRAGVWRFGVAYRHDLMKFPDSISTTTHTIPPSTSSSLSTTRESTESDVLEIRAGINGVRELTDRWRLRGGVDLAPATFARLTTRLPDKYPRPIRFSATAFSAGANAAAEWHRGRTVLAIGGELGHSWRTKRTSSYTRSQAAVSLSIGYDTAH